MIVVAAFVALAAACAGGDERAPLPEDGARVAGAPAPATDRRSVAFDPALVNVRAGTFPPLTRPEVVPAAEAPWMDPDTLVLGAVQNRAARAYPIFMLRLHHVVNDHLGGAPYLATF
jgi:hypothetical protein